MLDTVSPGARRTYSSLRGSPRLINSVVREPLLIFRDYEMVTSYSLKWSIPFQDPNAFVSGISEVNANSSLLSEKILGIGFEATLQLVSHISFLLRLFSSYEVKDPSALKRFLEGRAM